MTSEHVRKALILIFLINLVMIFQNFKSDNRVDDLQDSLREASEKGLVVAKENQALLREAIGELKKFNGELPPKDTK